MSINPTTTARTQTPVHLILIVGLLLIAAYLRIADLGHLPPGFSADEINSIQVAETVRQGTVASFYNVGDPRSGHEGLFPVVVTIATSLLGRGLISYRLASVALGLISVALMYALGRRLLGNFAGLAAAITLAVSFWPVLLSRSTIREALILPLIIALLWILSKAIHLRQSIGLDNAVNWPYFVLGVLIAALAYTHWTGLMGPLLVIAFVAYLIATRQRISRHIISFIGYALLLSLILGIPYLTFTLRRPQLSGAYAYWSGRPTSIGGFLTSTLETLGSLVIQGDLAPTHNVPGLPLIGPIGAALLIIGFVIAIRRWRSPNMMLILLALGLGIFPDAWSRTQPNFGTLTIALPALAALIGLGASSVMESVINSRRKMLDIASYAPALWAAVLVTITSAVVVAFLLGGPWASSGSVDAAFNGQLGRIAAYLDRTNDNIPTTLCTFNLTHADDEPGMSDPVLLDEMMHNENRPLRIADCLNGFVLADGGTRQRIAFANPRGTVTLSTAFQPWLDQATPILNNRLAPGSIVEINVAETLANKLGMLTLRHVNWEPGSIEGSAEGSTDASLPVRMGGYLTFEGYMLDTTKIYKPGDTVNVATYWRADGRQIADLRIFAHILRNPQAEPAAQNDLLSLDPTLLRDRDIFIQTINIPLPADFPSGEYFVSIGAYSSESRERVPVYDNDQPRGDRLFLDNITVQN